jgi:quercetin dioxygenase-like cupin family protein
MRKLWCGLLAAGALVTATGVLAAPVLPEGFVIATPSDLHWVDVPGNCGIKVANVVGSQDKPGVYVIRVRFPPHCMSTPHWHSTDRYVTVIEGTWSAGLGPVFDPSNTTPLGPGSFMKHPAGGVHWDGSAGEAAAVVQIIGMGPVTTTQVDPKLPAFADARGK